MKGFVKRLRDKFFEIFDGASVGVNGIFLVLIFVIVAFVFTVLQKDPIYYIKKANVIGQDIVTSTVYPDTKTVVYRSENTENEVKCYYLYDKEYFIDTDLELEYHEKVHLYEAKVEVEKISEDITMLDAIVPISKDHLKYVYKENVLYDCIDYFEGNSLSRLWVCAKCVFLYYFIGEGKSIIAGAIIGTFFIEVFCKSIVCFVVRRKKED